MVDTPHLRVTRVFSFFEEIRVNHLICSAIICLALGCTSHQDEERVLSTHTGHQEITVSDRHGPEGDQKVVSLNESNTHRSSGSPLRSEHMIPLFAATSVSTPLAQRLLRVMGEGDPVHLKLATRVDAALRALQDLKVHGAFWAGGCLCPSCL